MALVTGQLVGNLILRRRLPINYKAAPNMRKRWKVQCKCGTPEFDIPEYYLVRKDNPRTDCGCSRKSIKTHFNKEYRIWMMMHVRCYDPRHIAYKDYGGRGISICAEWHRNNPDGQGFARFLEFIGPRPSPGHSVDRINNDLGYQPFQPNGERQVKWATATEQRANQRTKVKETA